MPKELNILQAQWEASDYSIISLSENISELKAVNEKLWDIEDEIRIKEKERLFNNEFVQLARSVYLKNDKRAEIKRMINQMTGSTLVEEKSCSDYGV